MADTKRRLIPIFALAAAGAANALVAHADPASASFALTVSRSQARETLLGILDEARASASAPSAEATVELVKLLRSYRSASAPAVLSIGDAPFVPFVISSELPTIWGTPAVPATATSPVVPAQPGLYQSMHDQKLAELLAAIPLDSLLDGFMKMVVDGTATGDLAKTAKEIGPKLARKIIAGGKDASCKLDLSDAIPKKPSLLAQAWVKLTAGWSFPSACHARQVIFASAKAQLIGARKDPTVIASAKASFEEQFPSQFRVGFLQQMAGYKTSFPHIVAQKFQGADDSFWGVNTPLIETEDEHPELVTLADFNSGLRADIEASAALSASADPALRGLAAPLFYAAANRLLVLMGGNQAAWDSKAGAFVPTSGFDPKHPDAAPVLKTVPFGGWSVASSAAGPVMTSWDWANYDPTLTVNPSPMQLFPPEVQLGLNGVATLPAGAVPYETLSDVADTISSLVSFLELTRAGAVFAPHFGDASQIAQILDPTSPILFPRAGRMVAIGTLGGVLKNLVAPAGHVEQVDPGTHDTLGLLFHDQVTLTGRDDGGASIRGIAKVLIAASELRPALGGDADVPPELAQYLPVVDQALQVGAVMLSSNKGQAPDGGFYERYGVPMTTGRSLETAVTGMRALTLAYDQSGGTLLLRLSVKMGWLFLDSLWASGDLPQLIEGAGRQPIDPSVAWDLLRLWRESQKTVRGDLAAELDWAKWDSRFTLLRQKLQSQLGTAQGPSPL
jgi:hypothetical protein